jgi:ribonuclease HII
VANQAPTFAEEETLRKRGCHLVAGIDEVGRGPLAGPVVAAAVVLSLEARPPWLCFVRDSKQLTPRKRAQLFDCIRRDAVAFGVGIVASEVIDERGIVAATRTAMASAAWQLSVRPDFLLIDALGLPDVDLPQRSLIKGDTLSLSIAAASIVAKVTRDRMMAKLDGRFPGYGLARNKGYGTPEHLQGLRRFGPCRIHRRTFSPVREFFP